VFAFVLGHRNDHAVEQLGCPLRHIQVAIGYRVKTARIDCGTHGPQLISAELDDEKEKTVFATKRREVRTNLAGLKILTTLGQVRGRYRPGTGKLRFDGGRLRQAPGNFVDLYQVPEALDFHGFERDASGREFRIIAH
jgi:hypothetical protein